MHLNPHPLRHALAMYLGKELRPEAAAHIEAIATANPMPKPLVPEGCDLVIEQQQRFFDYINQALGSSYDPSSSRVIARVAADGAIRGVVLFNDPSKHAVEMAVASDGSRTWLSKTFLRLSFDYAFNQLGKLRVSSLVRTNNVKAVAFNESLGFVNEGCLLDLFGRGEHAFVMGMLRDGCAWILKD